MVTVPTYQPGQVGNDATIKTRAEALPTEDFGTGALAGLDAGAGALDHLASLQDEASAKQLDLQYAAYQREVLYGQQGLFGKQGINALNALPDVQQGLADKRDEILAQATTQRQRQMLTDTLNSRMTSALDSVGRFGQEQTIGYYRASSAASIQNNIDQYVAEFPTDPAKASAALQAARMEQSRLNSFNGGDADTEAQALLGVTTKAHAAVIDNMMARGDPVAADHYFQVVQGEMDPVTRANVGEQVRKASDAFSAQAAAGAVMASGAAASPPIAGGVAAGAGQSVLTPQSQITPDQMFARNSKYAKPMSSYQTSLSADQETKFEQWVKTNHIPFDPSEDHPDYDMRGYWQDIASKGGSKTAVNQNDGKIHFPDTYKTPYHHSFSNESKYATSDAPRWVNDHQLADAQGNVLFDEKPAASIPQGGIPDAIRSRAAAYGLDPNTAVGVALLENPTFNPKLKNPKSSAHGIFQSTDENWTGLGGTAADRDDPNAQIERGLQNLKNVNDYLTQKLGRLPSAFELYLGQQQGQGGAVALLSAPPEVNCIQALSVAYGGSVAKARRAILQNGGTEDSTVGQFLQLWQGKCLRKIGATATVAGPALNPTSGGVVAAPDRDTYVNSVVALAGPSQDRQMAFRAAAESRWKQMHEAETDADQNAQQAVQPLLRDPSVTTYDQFVQRAGPQLVAQLKQTTLTQIYDHFKAGGTPIVSDRTTVAALHGLYATNPDAFKNLDLTQYTSKLGNEDWEWALTHQDALRKGKAVDQTQRVSISTAMTLSKAQLAAIGVTEKSNPESYAHFQGSLIQAMDQYRRLNSKEPDAASIKTMSDYLMLSGEWKPDGAWFAKHDRLFNIPAGASHTIDIPDDAHRRIVSDFQKRYPGRTPSAEAIKRAYVGGVRAGVFQVQ